MLNKYILSLVFLFMCVVLCMGNPVVVSNPVAVVPLYSATYSEEIPTYIETLKEEVKVLKSEVKLLKSEIKRINKESSVNYGFEDDKVVRELFVDKCIKCHSADRGDGGFVLYDDSGSVRRLNDAEKVLVTKKIRSGAMPKPPVKLTAEEKNYFINLFTK